MGFFNFDQEGGFKNFLTGGLQGIQDKFAGISPQDRFKMDMERQKQEEAVALQNQKLAQDQEGQAALERFRQESLAGRDEDRAFRESNAAATNDFRQQQLAAQEAARAENIQFRTEDREDNQAFRREIAESQQNFQNQQRESDQAFRKELAGGGGPEFKPTAKFGDFYDPSNFQANIDESVKNYNQAVDAEFEAWRRRNSLQPDESQQDPTLSEGVKRIHKAIAERDEGVAIAEEEANKPGAGQDEIDEAESRKIAAIADFERFNETGANLQSHGAGPTGNADQLGESSTAPVLVEQDFSRSDSQERAKKDIEQFRQLAGRVAEGDPEAAKQLGELMGPEKIRGFQRIAEEYGPEVLNQLRQIYRQELHSDPPF